MTRQIKVDIFSDPACPWCLLGLQRFDRAAAELPADVKLEIAHHPFLLDANTPEGGEDVAEMLREKYGRDPAEAWDRLESEAKKSGLDLDMRKQKMRYPSKPAEALIASAAGTDAQHKLAIAIGHAYYLDAKDISDPEVLADIAGEFGFAREDAITVATNDAMQNAIAQASAEAAGQGIQGVPFFIFDSKYALSGGQPEEVFSQVFDKVLSEEDAGEA